MSRSSNDSEEDGEIDREETRYNMFPSSVASPAKDLIAEGDESDSYDTEDGGEDMLHIQPPQATIVIPKRRDRKRDRHSRKHEGSSSQHSRSGRDRQQPSSRDRGGAHREGRRAAAEGSRGGRSEQHDRHRSHRADEKGGALRSELASRSAKEQVSGGELAHGGSQHRAGVPAPPATLPGCVQAKAVVRDSGRSVQREPKEPSRSSEMRDARERIREAKEAREQKEREEREQERLQREWRKERLLIAGHSAAQRDQRKAAEAAAAAAGRASTEPASSSSGGSRQPRERSRSPLARSGGDDVPEISLMLEDERLTDIEDEEPSPVKVGATPAEAKAAPAEAGAKEQPQPVATLVAAEGRSDDDDDGSDLSSDSSSDDSSDSDDSSSSSDEDSDEDEKYSEDEKKVASANVGKGGSRTAHLRKLLKECKTFLSTFSRKNSLAIPGGRATKRGAEATGPEALSEEGEEGEAVLLPPYLPAIQGCRSVEEFHCLNRIEEGTYGVVYRARDKHTDEIVALKRLKMEKEKEGFPITSLREINTLLKAQHPNIVTVREIVVGSNMDKIYIVMDYVEHDLKSLMEVMQQPFLVGEVKTLMLQLLQAVAHLHDNWILHRDLKTSNLLLSHRGILKVGDFGLAREYGSPLKHYTPVVVTMWYRAPELLLGVKEYSTPIDLWSVGCIFGELLTMKPLFPGKSDIDQLNRIFKDLGTPSEKIWPGYTELPLVKKVTFTEYPYNNLRSRFGHTLSNLGFDLLNKFLTYFPSRRITAEEALRHEFFKETPVPVDPSMFPTWPAKSELGHRKAHSPKPPSGGKQFAKQLGEGDDEGLLAAAGFHMNIPSKGSSAKGTGFSLKF
ncbi:cyclin dependent kinase 11B pitslre isoform X3 [Haemaphysalis longicornis]